MKNSQLQDIINYYSKDDSENRYRNWGGYDQFPGLYALHSGYYPNAPIKLVRHKDSINIMDLEIIKRLQIPRNHKVRILDAGCGTGVLAIKIGQAFPLAEIWGITLAPNQGEQAIEYVKSNGIKNVSISIGDYTHTSFDSNFFDIVYFVESLAHAKNRLETLKETSRIVRRRGRILFQDPVLINTVDTSNSRFQDIMTVRNAFRIPGLLDSLEVITQYLIQAGFEDVTLENATNCVYPGTEVFGFREEPGKNREDVINKLPLHRQGWIRLRDLMIGYQTGTNLIGYYFITALKKAIL